MTDQIGLFEAMSTQRQITRFKKDPVPREAIDKIRFVQRWPLTRLPE